MRLYKKDSEIYAEKDQLALLLADGWSKEKPSDEVTDSEEVAGDEVAGDEVSGDEVSGDEVAGDDKDSSASQKVVRKISRGKKG